jgi:aconitate hydratase
MTAIETTPDLVRKSYARTQENLAVVRKRLGRPLTFAEKILFGHLDDAKGQDLVAGESYLLLRPDRVAMQDATAQMAMLQFMQAGRDETAVPSTVHCDHLIEAARARSPTWRRRGRPTRRSTTSCGPARPATASASGSPGAGIIHQVVLENYAFPGGMMIGTDSHTPNAAASACSRPASAAPTPST